MLTRIRFLTAGESHGPALGAIVEGLPAGIPIDPKAIDEQMARRQKGFGSGGRMKIEKDRAKIRSGVMNGKTTGGPILLEVINKDWANWRTKEIAPMSTPRPGHADLTGALKYHHADLRISLERASARETAMRVAVGAVCMQLLAQFNIKIGGYVKSVGPCFADLSKNPVVDDYLSRFKIASKNDLTCPDEKAAELMRDAINEAKINNDTLGGIMEIVAIGVPPGLGSYVHWDRRIEAKLSMAMMSIQAMKGVEVGRAFDCSKLPGTSVHDEIFINENGCIQRQSNNAGGIEGGITTGEPIVVCVAMKPIATTLNPRRSINLATGESDETTYERSDICAVSRAVPVGEAMMAIVLADALAEKLGGDSLGEMKQRFKDLATGKLSDFDLDNTPWKFGYED